QCSRGRRRGSRRPRGPWRTALSVERPGERGARKGPSSWEPPVWFATKKRRKRFRRRAREADSELRLPDGDGLLVRGDQDRAGGGEGDGAGERRADGRGGLAAILEIPGLQLGVGAPGVDRDPGGSEASSVVGEGRAAGRDGVAADGAFRAGRRV